MLVLLIMDDKEALTYLVEILGKYSLTEREKQAVQVAIGVLSWTKLKTGSLKNFVKNRETRKQRYIKG